MRCRALFGHIVDCPTRHTPDRLENIVGRYLAVPVGILNCPFLPIAGGDL